MGESTDQIKKTIISAFPKLGQDANFKITSKEDPSYNCIAWAYNFSDRWMWPNTGYTRFIDGIDYWPSSDIKEPSIQNFIEAFKLKGYEVCDGYQHEDGYQKVALYSFPNSNMCTHASRELRNGFWTSKLGPYQDIQHGDPTTIESTKYGKVCCILKRVFN